MNGRGTPVIGNRATKPDIFTNVWNPSQLVNPAATNWLNLSGALFDICTPLKIRTEKTPIRTTAPIKPSSFPTTAKIESVVTSGIKPYF